MRKPPQWLFSLRRTTAIPDLRLLVFPFAAAGATALRPLMMQLPDSVEVLGVALPGRERRFGEPPRTSHPEIVAAVGEELADREPMPTYAFGHSMGAGLVLALALMKPDLCLGVVISGRKPTGRPLGAVQSMTDDEVVAFLGAAGNTSRQLLKEPFWRAKLIALFRSDMALNERVLQATESGTLSQHLLVVGGDRDQYVDAGGLPAWDQRTTGRCDVRVFPGNHFFLLDPENLTPLAEAIYKFIA
ncbi:MAG TPA: alpha/beta fold hydrolase [Acidobacteriaceae bacterium]|nr:alpha/beta fold hydrolase [Acidobacteriaceae bacterium]